MPTAVKSHLPRPRRRREYDLATYLRMVRRVVAGAGRRVAEADVEDLEQLLAIRAELDAAIVSAVRGLRGSGYTWEQIGSVTGVTRQAALLYYGPRLAALEEAS